MKSFLRFAWLYSSLLLIAGFLTVLPDTLAAEASDNAAVRDFNAAAALQNSGFYDRAAQKWADFVRKYPSDSRLDRVHYYLGICQLHTKKYPEAARTFQTVLSKYRNFSDADGAQYNLSMAYFQIAAASKKADDFKTAAGAFGGVASKYATSKYAHKALYYQGESLYSAGDRAGAIAAYKALTTKYRDSSLLADAYYAMGTTQQELGLDAEAGATFAAFLANKTFEKHELANEIRLRLAMSLFAEKKYAEAEPHFAAVAAVAEFRDADFAMLRQGQCRMETGKVAEAAAVFAALLGKFPNSTYKAGAQLAAGKCLYMLEKYDDAQKMLQPLVTAGQEESAEATYWLARALLKLNKPKDALTVLDRAVKDFKTGEFSSHLQLARIDALYDLPDRRKETAAAYANFAQQFPDHALTPQAVYMAALAALGDEDYAAAQKHALAFLANQKYAELEVMPAVLYIAAEAFLLPVQAEQTGGDTLKAQQYYQQLVAKYPNHSRVPRAHLRIGWCLYQSKKYDDSIRQLSGALAKLKDPAHVAEAQLLIGRNYAAGGRHKEAVAAYDAALKAKADWSRTDEVLLAAAASLRTLDDPAAAALRLTQLNSKYPESTYRAQTLYQLGEIAQEQKKYDEAIPYYTEVLAKYPGSELAPAANYGLAAAHFAKDKFDEAIAPLEKLLAAAAEPQLLARGRYLRGLVYQRQKKFDTAAADLEAFLAGKPSGEEAADARYALALCRIRLNQFQEATAAMATLMKEHPGYAYIDKMYYEMGHALLAADKRLEAANTFRTLAKGLPDSPLTPESWFHVGRYHEATAEKTDAADQKSAEVVKAAEAYAAGAAKAKTAELHEKLLYKLGDMQFRQKKYAEAAATLLEQVAKHPSGELAGPARFLAAESLFRLKQFGQALPLFVQVADAKVPKYHAQSLYRAGTCAKNVKNWPESQKRYQELLTQFPDFEQLSEARYGLGLALQNQNKLDEAKTVYEQVTKETETETAAKARFMIGEIAFGRGNYEDAIEQYLLVAVGYAYPEWQALARVETGRCFIELGQKDKARAELQIVVDKFPDHPKAKDAAKLIAELK